MASDSEYVNATGYVGIRRGRRLGWTLLVFLFTTWSHTQEPANPPSVTFRTNANLVVLDAVVKDRDGKSVTNLTKDDFTVLEDGVVQTIASFESASSKGRPAPAAATGQNNNEPKPSAPVPQQALTILVLDELNSEVFDQAYGRNAIEKFLAKHGPRLEQPASLMLLGQKRIELLHDYTQDAGALAHALHNRHAELPFGLLAAEFSGAAERFSKTLWALQQIAAAIATLRGARMLSGLAPVSRRSMAGPWIWLTNHVF